MSEEYQTPRGVEAAIKEAARKAVRADPSSDVNRWVQLEHFNRFLSRVFSDGPTSRWLLKGGTSMLARVASARATRDIDLAGHGFTLDEALDDLRRLSAVDLGDHFRFEYVDHTSLGTANQPYAEGCSVKFTVSIGGAAKGHLKVDLVVAHPVTGTVLVREPASALHLPRLVNRQYRLYPVVDHVADKVCATVADYGGIPSTREKDLVDLVVLAATEDIDGSDLAAAVLTEARRRQLVLPDRFTVPASWGAGYFRLSRAVPHCLDYPSVELAVELVGRLVDPASSGDAAGKTWSHEALDWS